MYLGSRKTPRSSFMRNAMGAATLIESPPIIAPPADGIHPIYMMPPTVAPTPPAPGTVFSVAAPNWFWYAAIGGLAYYWWFRKES